jgi:putative FmdB family regulatory protein
LHGYAAVSGGTTLERLISWPSVGFLNAQYIIIFVFNQALLDVPKRSEMPIYEYRCSSCGHELEVLQKLSEPRLTVCPSCSATALVKMVSAAGFQLKGTGWYATDFKGSGSKPAAKPAEGAAKSGEPQSGSDNKTESNTEKKSESKPDSTATKSESTSSSESKSGTKSSTPVTPSSAGPAGS